MFYFGMMNMLLIFVIPRVFSKVDRLLNRVTFYDEEWRDGFLKGISLLRLSRVVVASNE